MTWCVYVYYDPKGCVPRYVGKGRDAGRALAHLKRSHNPQLHNMIQKRLREGYEIHPQVIDCIDTCNAGAGGLEIALIKMLGRVDLGTGTLFNLTDGGEGSHVLSPLVRAARNEKLSKVMFTPQRRAKLSALARNRTSQHRARLSTALKGCNAGRPTSARQKSAASATFKGKPLSLEHRGKLARAACARPTVQCNKCGKLGQISSMKRWHFDNCRH